MIYFFLLDEHFVKELIQFMGVHRGRENLLSGRINRVRRRAQL
jgi:hypothetical protein